MSLLLSIFLICKWYKVGERVSALITWFAAWWYYRKASKDLLKESHELRRLNTLMLHGMEYSRWIKLTRDKEGNILGFEQVIKPSGILSDESFGKPTIIQHEPNNET